MQEDQLFHVESGGGESTSVKFHLHYWDKQQARIKGFLWAAPFLLGGLLTIFIPIVHFVSVPASLIIAPVIYLTVSKLFASGVSFSGRAQCPACHKQVKFSGSTDEFPSYVNCPECRGALKVTPAGSH